MNQPATLPLVDSLLDAPLSSSGIEWLDAARRESLQAFAAQGLPDARVEAWKYTALRALSQRRFAALDVNAAMQAMDISQLVLPGVDGPRLVFVNGVFRADLSVLDAMPAGLELQSLSAALESHPEPLRFAMSRRDRDAGDAFEHINLAAATDGVVLRVSAHAKVVVPIHLAFVDAAGEADVVWHARNLIELGEGAELELIEHHLAIGEPKHLATLVTDIDLHQGARLRHTCLQNAAAGTSMIRYSSYRLQQNAHVALHAIELGSALMHHDLRVELLGDGTSIDTRGVFMPHGRQHIDTQLAIRHQGLNTRSSSVWRGVASDRARGVFRGAILVAPGADGSDASLSNKNLLLSPNAEIDTKPELEIHADEVKAAHGATVGQLDERSLFYLRSRGIALAEARALLTAAFCRAVLDDLENQSLREHLASLLTGHLPA